MYYLTTYKKINQTPTQNTEIDDYTALLNAQTTSIETPIFKKITIAKEQLPYTFNPTKRQQLQNYLENAYCILEPFKNNYATQYYTFQIPKHSGGLRTINAPNTEFKEALSKVKNIFENQIKCLAHNAAYAYIKNRSIKDALIVHQNNHSNWYLKIDLKNFFPSCTPEILFQNISHLYPFYLFDEEHLDILRQIIQICTLENGLPQGTPMSPLLTNLLMVSYDFKITQLAQEFKAVYTRYADDILISAQKSFNFTQLQDKLRTILNPFQINTTKTRYGSKAGRNWNLGLMLNKDNNITLGSEKKKLLNAMLNNFLRDYTNNIIWSLEDVYQLQGHLSYLNQIEPDYYNYIVQKYEAKYNILDYRNIIKSIINHTV